MRLLNTKAKQADRTGSGSSGSILIQVTVTSVSNMITDQRVWSPAKIFVTFEISSIAFDPKISMMDLSTRCEYICSNDAGKENVVTYIKMTICHYHWEHLPSNVWAWAALRKLLRSNKKYFNAT
jgi:membrane associated rhomboid family serine protease